MSDILLSWVGAVSGLLGALMALISLKITWDQKKLQERSAYLHLAPTLGTAFSQEGKNNPFLKIQNIGDISIVSLSIIEDVVVFDKRTKQITAAAKTGNSLSERVYYKPELKPTDSDTLHSVRFDADYLFICIYRYKIKFYRLSDMSLFQREENYFVEDGSKIFTHEKFRESSIYYDLVMRCLETFRFPGMDVRSILPS